MTDSFKSPQSPEVTLSYYSRNASTIAARYERVASADSLQVDLSQLKAKAKVLEIGCGSGRDAAALVNAGFEVTAIDGSQKMLEQALAYHPELAGRLLLHQLPMPLPFEPEGFDAVIALAVLLHLTKDEIVGTLKEVHRVLTSSGQLIYSVNTARPGLDEDGVDSDGRYFTVMSRAEWEVINKAAGFRCLEVVESEDVIGRDGVKWISFVLAKSGDPK